MQQTEEPLALYFTGAILNKMGNKAAAKNYPAQAQDAGFELGPVLKDEIDQDLSGI